MSIGGHQSPVMKQDEWLTPPAITAALGPVDLDPCAPISPPWRIARHALTREDDGLTAPWHGRVWMNPPYGREVGAWLARLADHGNGIALIFARTETKDFHKHVWRRAAALLFLAGRLHFHHPNGTRAPCNAGAPSVLIAYGQECAVRLRRAQPTLGGALVIRELMCRSFHPSAGIATNGSSFDMCA